MLLSEGKVKVCVRSGAVSGRMAPFTTSGCRNMVIDDYDQGICDEENTSNNAQVDQNNDPTRLKFECY